MLLIARPMDVVDEAAWLTEAERTEGVRRVQGALEVAGEAECIGCGDVIEADRRDAMPSARRCVDCEVRVEGRDRGRRRQAIVGDEFE